MIFDEEKDEVNPKFPVQFDTGSLGVTVLDVSRIKSLEEMGRKKRERFITNRYGVNPTSTKDGKNEKMSNVKGN